MNSWPEKEIGNGDQHSHSHIKIGQCTEIDQPGTDSEAKCGEKGNCTTKRRAPQPVDDDYEEFAGDDVDTLVVDLVELDCENDTWNECDQGKSEDDDAFVGRPETLDEVLF